jgi:hypothetical protein
MSTAVMLSIVAFVGLIACLVTFLIWTNRDPSNLISFIASIVPVTIGVILVSSRVDKVQNTTESIQDSVNGKLDDKFAALHARMDEVEAAVAINTAHLANATLATQQNTQTMQEGQQNA